MNFRGGYNFKNFEGTAEPFLHELPPPKKVILKLGDGICASFTSLVQEGDTVRAGSKLLESDDDGKCTVASPVNGTVTCFDEQEVIIASDGSEGFDLVEDHTRTPWHLNHSDLLNLMSSTGCQLLLDRQFETTGECSSVEHIIINTLHNGTLDQAWSPELFGEAGFFAKGLLTLKALFPRAEMIIAINKRNKSYFSSGNITSKAAVHTLSDNYPQEHPELLCRDTVNKRLITEDGTPDETVIVIPFSNVIHISESMTQGRPLIDRIILVAGPGVSKPGWYRIRIGTTFDEIKTRLLKSDAKEPWRIIKGNPLSGEGLDSLNEPILFPDHEISVIREHASRDLFSFLRPGFTADSYSKSTLAEYIPILPKKLETNVHGGVRPCVQCNHCDEVCPVDIYPFLIWKHVEVDAVEESFRLRPYDCIECGLCDYVCPSKIDILSSVKKAKEEYRKLRRTDDISD